MIVDLSSKQVTKKLNFLVVNYPSAYNAILGLTSLNQLKEITSIYHLMMRFSTNYGVGEVKGDQTTVQECYNASLVDGLRKEALAIEEAKTEKKGKSSVAEPMEDLIKLNLDESVSMQVVQVGSTLMANH